LTLERGNHVKTGVIQEQRCYIDPHGNDPTKECEATGPEQPKAADPKFQITMRINATIAQNFFLFPSTKERKKHSDHRINMNHGTNKSTRIDGAGIIG